MRSSVPYRLSMFPLGIPTLPGMVLPLRIFEPRYVVMLESCLQSPQPQFGVVMIERGSEVGGGEVRRSVGTVVDILRVDVLPRNQFSVFGIGVRRLRVDEWLIDDPHPMAMVTDIEENVGDSPVIEAQLERLEKRTDDLIDREQLAGSNHLEGDPHRRVYSMASRLGLGALDLQRVLEGESIQSQIESLEESILHLEEIERFRTMP